MAMTTATAVESAAEDGEDGEDDDEDDKRDAGFIEMVVIVIQFLTTMSQAATMVKEIINYESNEIFAEHAFKGVHILDALCKWLYMETQEIFDEVTIMLKSLKFGFMFTEQEENKRSIVLASPRLRKQKDEKIAYIQKTRWSRFMTMMTIPCFPYTLFQRENRLSLQRERARTLATHLDQLHQVLIPMKEIIAIIWLDMTRFHCLKQELVSSTTQKERYPRLICGASRDISACHNLSTKAVVAIHQTRLATFHRHYAHMAIQFNTNLSRSMTKARNSTLILIQYLLFGFLMTVKVAMSAHQKMKGTELVKIVLLWTLSPTRKGDGDQDEMEFGQYEDEYCYDELSLMFGEDDHLLLMPILSEGAQIQSSEGDVAEVIDVRASSVVTPLELLPLHLLYGTYPETVPDFESHAQQVHTITRLYGYYIFPKNLFRCGKKMVR